MKLRLVPLLCALAIVGCGTTQRQAQIPIAVPFAGTWHQAGTTPDAPAGFLAIAGDRLLFNLDGLPRGAVDIAQNDTDAGLRSGRVVCADGRILYLAVGDSLTTRESDDGRLLTPTSHLDVHVFAAGAGAGDQPQKVLRLWPSSALAVAALPAPSRVTASPMVAAPAQATPMVGSAADQRFADSLVRLDDPYLASIADRLSRARTNGRGTAEFDDLWRRSTLPLHGEVLHDLDAARQGDRAALGRADRRLTALDAADRAYATWRDQR